MASPNEAQFKALFEAHYSSLCYFANKLIIDHSAAEDLVNEVFLHLWKQNTNLKDHANIKALLYTSVKNDCFDYIKKRKRRRLKNNDLSYLLQGETENFALNAIIQAEYMSSIYSEIKKLPADCRTVMQLMYEEGWDNRKIASHLGIAESTVRNQKFRGIKVLRNKLGLIILVCCLIYHRFF